MRRALVIAAHPDDAELMVGGLIAALAERGVLVTVAFFTNPAETSPAKLRRQQAADDAAEILGHDIAWVQDGALTQVVDLPEHRCVSLIDGLLKECEPDMVVTHDIRDSHCDHAQLARCVIAATRRCDATFYAFGPSDYRAQTVDVFSPNVFVDISAYVAKKRAAIDSYNYDGAPFRELSADDILSLNRASGVQCGAQYAESLQLIRQVGIPTDLIGAPPRLS